MVTAILMCVIVPVSKGRDLGWPLWVFEVMSLVPLLISGFLRYEARLSKRGGMPYLRFGGVSRTERAQFFALSDKRQQPIRHALTQPIDPGLRVLPRT